MYSPSKVYPMPPSYLRNVSEFWKIVKHVCVVNSKGIFFVYEILSWVGGGGGGVLGLIIFEISTGKVGFEIYTWKRLFKPMNFIRIF